MGEKGGIHEWGREGCVAGKIKAKRGGMMAEKQHLSGQINRGGASSNGCHGARCGLGGVLSLVQ